MNTYHKLTLKNIDGEKYDWIFSDKERLNKRFREYQRLAREDIAKYPDSNFWENDKIICVRVIIKYDLKTVYEGNWTVTIVEDLGFN